MNPSLSCCSISDNCHHFRAVQIFTSTILPVGDCCQATKCDSSSSFDSRKCSDNKKRKMGFGSKATDGPSGKYFLTTGENDPYCGKLFARN